MTDKYTIEEIEAVLRDFHSVPDGPNFKIAEEKADAIISALTKPEYEFREGEVIYRQGVGYVQIHHWNVQDGRPLRLSEMPKAVEDLRSYVEGLTEYDTSDGKYFTAKDVVEHSKSRLSAFDEVIEP